MYSDTLIDYIQSMLLKRERESGNVSVSKRVREKESFSKRERGNEDKSINGSEKCDQESE